MIKREIICDLCRRPIMQGQAVMAFQFEDKSARLPGEERDTFDYSFSDIFKMERHWCVSCLKGVASMVPDAISTLKTIGEKRHGQS